MTSTRQPPWLSRFARSLSLCSALIAAAGAANAQTVPSIQFNQIGYLTAGAKVGGCERGHARCRRWFSVVDAKTGQVVFRGTLVQRRVAAVQAVRLADFGGLQTPGSYRLRVAGVPDSAPFSIAGNSYEAVTRAAIRAYTSTVRRIELKPEHAQASSRGPAGHPDTVVRIHASAAGPKRKEGDVISSPKGAGTTRATTTSTSSTRASRSTRCWPREHHTGLLQALRALNIPERNDGAKGLPDLLSGCSGTSTGC